MGNTLHHCFEHCKVLDSIVRQVQLRQTGQVFESGDICQAVTTEVNLLDIFDLLTCLCQLLKLLALAHNLGQLHALSVISVINGLKELTNDTWLEHKLTRWSTFFLRHICCFGSYFQRLSKLLFVSKL